MEPKPEAPPELINQDPITLELESEGVVGQASNATVHFKNPYNGTITGITPQLMSTNFSTKTIHKPITLNQGMSFHRNCQFIEI